jgi:hypothetical protein
VSTVEEVAATFADDMHHNPERARGNCFNESHRFVHVLSCYGIDAEVVSGVKMAEFMGHEVVMDGHAAARVGDVVYDWTARQFWPHDQPVPLVQTYEEWRAEWRRLGSSDTEERAS